MTVSQSTMQLPRGPKGRIQSTLAIIRNPKAAFDRWIARYGDPFFVHTLNGPVVMTGRPELIRIIFGEDPANVRPFAPNTLEPMLGVGSLLAMKGDTHKRERRMLTPVFHGERMKAYGQIMQDVALESIRPLATGKPFAFLPITVKMSLEVISRTIFGGGDPAKIRQLMEASQQLVHRAHPLLFFSKKTHFSLGGWSFWDRYRKTIDHLNGLLADEIKQSQADAARGESRTDVLSMLVAATYDDGQHLTQDHICDQLRTLLFAGHETSALTLAWAMYLVLRHPNVLARLRSELDEAENDQPATLAQLPYLKAIVQETLRIHPIVTEVLRLLDQPMQLGDYLIPAGHGVAAAIVATHYREELYPSPDQFRPERFLERTFSPFEYLPFGGGHRRCIGAAFAMYELTIMLGTLIRRFDFELLESQPVVPKRRSVTMGPSTGIRLRCTPLADLR